MNASGYQHILCIFSFKMNCISTMIEYGYEFLHELAVIV